MVSVVSKYKALPVSRCHLRTRHRRAVPVAVAVAAINEIRLRQGYALP